MTPIWATWNINLLQPRIDKISNGEAKIRSEHFITEKRNNNSMEHLPEKNRTGMN